MTHFALITHQALGNGVDLVGGRGVSRWFYRAIIVVAVLKEANIPPPREVTQTPAQEVLLFNIQGGR